jgi:uncharacterized membrane protein YdbT with pleckstrin-like domain
MKFQNDEEVLCDLQPQGNILIVWFFTRTLPFAGIFTGLAVIAIFFYTSYLSTAKTEAGMSFSQVFIWLPVTAFIVGLIVGVIYCFYLKSTYKYYITNHRCIFCGGIILKIQRSVPYHKITDVETSQDIIERILGFSTLNIFTPGTGSITPSGKQKAELSFVGLKDSEKPADTINKMLEKLSAVNQ